MFKHLIQLGEQFSTKASVGSWKIPTKHVEYTKEFQTFIQALEKTDLILTGFDWMSWIKDKELPPTKIESLNELKQWFTFFLRNERFVTGFWLESIKNQLLPTLIKELERISKQHSVS